MTLDHVRGQDIRSRVAIACDVVVVGSGPAGATVAARLAARGVKVVVVEEGHYASPSEMRESALPAMASLYRDMGTSIAFGTNPMPYLQGRVVGGTSVINGAICWDFPEHVLERWLADDPPLASHLSYEALKKAQDVIKERLHVAPTRKEVAGEKSHIMAGAEALGVAHRPILRNETGCVGSGRCLQGCPHGAKLSMDRSLLPDAVRDGATLIASVRIDRILTDDQGAYGVVGRTKGGGHLEVRARQAVVIAASAIQSPVLLQKSGITQGPIGKGLSAHPGVSVTGRFPQSVRNELGATQGHEITGWLGEGFKIETLGFDFSILASRIPGAGRDFGQRLQELDHYAVFGAAIAAEARGTVRKGFRRPRVRYSLTEADLRKTRRAVRRMCEVMLAAGASEVYPGIPGFDPIVATMDRVEAIEREASLDPNHYAMSMTHLFGTATMGTNPENSVVGGDFQHHRVAGLYIADSSVFPTNLGVNPQIAIMAMASLCAETLLAKGAV